MLPHYARCAFSRLCCNGHSLLLSYYLPRIGRIENPLCSVCGHPSEDTSHLILYCPVADSLRHSLFGDSLSTTSGPGHGMFPGFWGSMVFHNAHIPQKGSGNNKVFSCTQITFQLKFSKFSRAQSTGYDVPNSTLFYGNFPIPTRYLILASSPL